MKLLVGQRAAAALVGAVLLALPTGTALAASAGPAAAAPAVTSAVSPSSSAAEHDSAKQVESDASQQVTHTVANAKPAESLWSIAQDRLGDGNRWEEIARLNDGRTMGDGQTFHTDAPIHVGWILNLPADARPAPDSGKEVGVETQSEGSKAVDTEYTVETGDSLSKIAADELGDESKYPAIFELNKDERQPGGGRFTNPDRIFPGQSLTLPAPAAAPDDNRPGADTQHRPDTPATPAPDEAAPDGAQPDTAQPDEAQPDEALPPAPSGSATPERPTSPSSPTPSASTPSTTPSKDSEADGATPSASTTPSSAAPQATTTPAAGDNAGQEEGSQQQIALVAGIGALLAASLAGTLGVKRILQQRRRKAGERIAIDSDPSLLEQIFNTSGEPASAALLDSALRTLASHASSGTGQELPVIRGARITGRTVHLLPDNQGATPLPRSPPPTYQARGRWTRPSRCWMKPPPTRCQPLPGPGHAGSYGAGRSAAGQPDEEHSVAGRGS